MSRTILITGTSRGIGYALANNFLSMGDSVIGCSRSEASINHQNYRHYHADLGKESSVTELFKKIRQEYRRIDALINNAGIAKMNAFKLMPVDTLQKLVQVNFISTFSCCQKAFSLLRRSENPRIINFTTIAVPMRLEGEAAYAASKSAIETLTQILAKEFGYFGITCNAIGPCPIETDLIKGVSKEKIDQIIRHQSIKSTATVDDVKNVIDFFMSPQSKMITGQIIYLGGIF
jgi:3-oxoacyl-[acyl-carrier protein] reductase